MQIHKYANIWHEWLWLKEPVWKITNLLGVWPVWGSQPFFPPIYQGCRVQNLTDDPHCQTPVTSWKRDFSDWLRPKKGERVMLGHFRDWVSISPRKIWNFAASGTLLPLFVPEVDLELMLDQISQCKSCTVLINIWFTRALGKGAKKTKKNPSMMDLCMYV